MPAAEENSSKCEVDVELRESLHQQGKTYRYHLQNRGGIINKFDYSNNEF